MIIGRRTAKNVQIFLIGWKTWLPGDETRCFSYVNIGITFKIFLSKSTWSIENNSTRMVIEWPSTKIVHILSVEKYYCQERSLFLTATENFIAKPVFGKMT